MTISEDVRGLEVTVRTNQQPLQEYQSPDAHEDGGAAPARGTTVRYIESVDNAEFDISIKVHPTYQWGYRNHVLVANVYVDGKLIRGCVIRNYETDFGFTVHRIVRGKEVGPIYANAWSLRKFKFSVVKTIDDAPKERLENDIKMAKGLGTIEVKFSRGLEYGPGFAVNRQDYRVNLAGFELAEKSLKGKAVSHGTLYQACEPILAPTWVDVRDLPEGPIAVFKFMYRSRDALKSEFIIPRSPSRSPTLDNLSVAERDRLARERLQELRNEKLKQENGHVAIKREASEWLDLTGDEPEGSARKKKRHPEVIDLTED
ncbi:hypothetical protein F5Y17DRAFT_181178 [Xylariaceae sp. FL0594]|nr:hypothetical protein F5Y17DRAFT_181178 [Xylariaceae sp. FL0594]